MLLQGGRKAALGVALTSRAVSRSPVGSALAPRASRTYARQQQSWDDDAGSGGSGDGDERRNGPRQERTSTWRAPRDLPPHWADRKDGKGAEPPKKRKKQPRVIQHPPPSEADLQRYAEMRVRRAERLERKDLTSQLTPVKTYMGGFTQPRHFEYLTVMDPTRKAKDSYDVRIGPDRVRPDAEAYTPHTVFLAVTRYPVRWGHGRATRRECFSSFCSESELEQRFKELNYGTWKEDETKLVKLRHGHPKEPVLTPAHWHCRDESKEYLDLAVLPGSPEERSLLNRPASHLIRALESEKKRLLKAQTEDATATSISGRTIDEIDELIAEHKSRLLPPVVDYVRPGPPYTEPPLAVPFLTVTLPTRPLAATVARLCNGHPRGLPFIASIPNEDRKDGPALFRRLLRMRTDRIRELVDQLVYRLEGNIGGMMSVRLSPEDKGRGLDGEGLDKKLEAPPRGWAEYSFLDEHSSCWDGLAREQYLSSWEGMPAQVKPGPPRTEKAAWSSPHPLLGVTSTAIPGVDFPTESMSSSDPETASAALST
ncbi:hypothetical protein BMF94_5497 [Rhodotorula taiwanensis]|uniref:Uncharacterized protein n=1 Tax=Rhodotorula taiwanensis TaxID=741276 RepID=A0A2S5B337_9BASI|nr:hypothetical protein BMF94_5497 [Rhodotorula taiwanensis]